jgi:hypothetical protein
MRAQSLQPAENSRKFPLDQSTSISKTAGVRTVLSNSAKAIPLKLLGQSHL